MRAALALAVVVLAGCVTPAAERELAGDGSARAAGWRVGDWWTYRFTSDVYADEFEATLVVGAADDGGFLVGMPAEEFDPRVVLYHLPPAGRLTAGLAYDVHGAPFEPFRFPLRDGLAWTTRWIAAEVRVVARAEEVEAPGGREAGFRLTNDGEEEAAAGRAFAWTWAPSAAWFGEYARVDPEGRVRERLQLVAHGRGFEGEVRLLDGVTVVLLEARTAGALAPTGPAAPVLAFEPPPEVDRLMVACVYGGGPGTYSATIRSPSGEACANAGTVPPADLRIRAASAEVEAEPGRWEARLVAGGAGNAVAEVLGYRSWTVELGG